MTTFMISNRHLLTVREFCYMLQATEALRITAQELVSFGVMDGIIEEPLGGAHSEPMASFPAVKEALMNIYKTK